MNPPDDRSSEVRDFREILSNPIDGQLPLLIGGHAVNLWALFYQNRIGREMDQWLPLTGKDLDLFGTLALLEGMKDRFRGEYRELASKIASSSDVPKCTTSHGIDFSGIWPRELVTSAKDPRLQNFVKHRLPSLA